MCVVSVTLDALRQVPPQQWNRPAFDEMQEVLRLLRQLDARLGQPDCEDPAKAAWMREIEQRLARLEGAQV